MGATHFSGPLTSEATIADILDKGSGAVILFDGEFLRTTVVVLRICFTLARFHHLNVSRWQFPLRLN